jgi:acylphosphatase|tara:strand:- start:37 stop:309 length:273 start_codon:yes stop_codon:yes gene_type:complete
MKTNKIIISGTVQGVFFRNFVKEQAEKLGLKGFARNLDDGRVEVIVEGRDENVNEMVKKCKQGPAQSEIKEIEQEELNHQSFDSFKILTG